MSLGLQRAGFEIIQAYNVWPPAFDVYRQNVSLHVWKANLKDIFHIAPMVAALKPDLIWCGQPCQDFSKVGEPIEGERAALTRAFAMIICIARPKRLTEPTAARHHTLSERTVVCRAVS